MIFPLLFQLLVLGPGLRLASKAWLYRGLRCASQAYVDLYGLGLV